MNAHQAVEAVSSAVKDRYRLKLIDLSGSIGEIFKDWDKFSMNSTSSPLGPFRLWDGPGTTEPRTVYQDGQITAYRWPWADYALLHEFSHLVLWHPTGGVAFVDEQHTLVLECAWARAIVGDYWADRWLRFPPNARTIIDRRGPYGQERTVNHWARPKATSWWAKARADLVSSGVLEEDGSPSWERPDWSLWPEAA